MKSAFEIHIEGYTDEAKSLIEGYTDKERNFIDTYYVIASNPNLAVIALINRLIENNETISAITKIEQIDYDGFDGVFPIDFNVINGD